MAIYRNRTQQQYTNIANSIFRNKDLSLRDRELLTTLLSLPDNWKFSVMGLIEILKKDGKHTISAGLASLEEKGYLVRRQLKSEDGKFKGYEWEIFEEPQKKPLADFQKTDNLQPEKSSPDNPTQSNTNKLTTKESINYQSSDEEIYKDKWQYGEVIKQIPEGVAETVLEELMKRELKEKITAKSFLEICKQIEGYGKPISNLRAFVKRCVDNYMSGNVVPYQPKKKSLHNFQQREYDFEELERLLLSN